MDAPVTASSPFPVSLTAFAELVKADSAVMVPFRGQHDRLRHSSERKRHPLQPTVLPYVTRLPAKNHIITYGIAAT